MRSRLDVSWAALRDAMSARREERMSRTKEWFDTHVAMEITPILIRLARRMSRANCSRIGMRMLSCARRPSREEGKIIRCSCGAELRSPLFRLLALARLFLAWPAPGVFRPWHSRDALAIGTCVPRGRQHVTELPCQSSFRSQIPPRTPAESTSTMSLLALLLRMPEGLHLCWLACQLSTCREAIAENRRAVQLPRSISNDSEV